MSWRETFQSRFGGALPLDAYLDAVDAALAPYGFTPERTFAAVSICRDELTQSLIPEVARRWDHPFNLGGLGGLPSLGRTGWGTCLAHVPHEGGRGHLLVFGFPHVGIDPDGRLGSSLRRHQDAPTPTCGALASVLETLDDPPPADPTTEALADAEARRLRRLVTAELDGPPADLGAFTRAAAAAVEREMWAELEALAPWGAMDVAVFTGIQIHVPACADRILPLTAAIRTGADTAAHPLELGT